MSAPRKPLRPPAWQWLEYSSCFSAPSVGPAKATTFAGPLGVGCAAWAALEALEPAPDAHPASARAAHSSNGILVTAIASRPSSGQRWFYLLRQRWTGTINQGPYN